MCLSDNFTTNQTITDQETCILSPSGVSPSNVQRCARVNDNTTTADISNNALNVTNTAVGVNELVNLIYRGNENSDTFCVSNTASIDVTSFSNPNNRIVSIQITVEDVSFTTYTSLLYNITKTGTIIFNLNNTNINWDALRSFVISVVSSTGPSGSFSLSLTNFKTFIGATIINPSECNNGMITVTNQSLSHTYTLTTPCGRVVTSQKGNFYVTEPGTYILSDGCCSLNIVVCCEQCCDGF